MIARQKTASATSEATRSASAASRIESPSSAWKPSTAQYFACHMPIAAASSTTAWSTTDPARRLAAGHLDARQPQADVRERRGRARRSRRRSPPPGRSPGSQRLERLADRLVASPPRARSPRVASPAAAAAPAPPLALAAALTTALPHPASSAARAAAAPGSSASAIARTTTTRRAPASSTAGERVRVDAADREPRRGRRRAPRGGRGRARSPGGPPSSASRGRGRRRSSRRPRRRRPARSECVERPTIRSPTTARASGTGVSSWPTWTPSAPAASTRSGRSLRMNVAPASSHSARATCGRGEDLLVGRVLLAQLEDVDPVGQRGREHVGERPPRRGWRRRRSTAGRPRDSALAVQGDTGARDRGLRGRQGAPTVTT